MQIMIDLPKEFEVDIKDKFQDFFKRLEAETSHHMDSGTNLVCGNYELETIQMFIQAFANGIQLPKGHGRLIDADAIDTSWSDNEVVETLQDAPTIVEADKTESEVKND